MLENSSSVDAMGGSSDELLKVLVDKVVDNGMILRECRDHIRKAVVQNERLEELSLQTERIEQGLGTTNRALVSGQEQVRQTLMSGQADVEKALASGQAAMEKKLDSAQGALVKAQNAACEAMLNEVRLLGKKVDTDRLVACMQGVENVAMNHMEFFKKPSVKEVHHRHFIGYPIVVLFVLVVVTAVMAAGWWNSHSRVEQYQEADVKWRYLRLWGNTVLTTLLDSAQRWYQANPEQFRKDVIGEEEHRKELEERQRQLRENQERIDELNKGGKKR